MGIKYRDMNDPEKDRVPHICHRIDKETSGVLLFAFSEKLKAAVSLQFEQRTVKKQYEALLKKFLKDADQVDKASTLLKKKEETARKAMPKDQQKVVAGKTSARSLAAALKSVAPKKRMPK